MKGKNPTVFTIAFSEKDTWPAPNYILGDPQIIDNNVVNPYRTVNWIWRDEREHNKRQFCGFECDLQKYLKGSLKEYLKKNEMNVTQVILSWVCKTDQDSFVMSNM